MFYGWSNKISKKVKMPRNVANFRLIDRRPLNEILQFGEKNRVFRVQVPYVGFKVCEVLFSRPKRIKGVSKYNPKSMFSLAISSTISLTVRPLEWSIGLTIVLGIIALLSSLGEATLFILHLCKIIYLSEVSLWGWLILNVLLVVSTIIVFVIAILSQYIAKNTIETLARPAVIIDEVIKK
jgi:dolichol-phosphate mannosyltransferase